MVSRIFEVSPLHFLTFNINQKFRHISENYVREFKVKLYDSFTEENIISAYCNNRMCFFCMKNRRRTKNNTKGKGQHLYVLYVSRQEKIRMGREVAKINSSREKLVGILSRVFIARSILRARIQKKGKYFEAKNLSLYHFYAFFIPFSLTSENVSLVSCRN